MIPSAVATAIGGTQAGMAFGLAAGFTMAVAPFAGTRQALGSAVIAAGFGRRGLLGRRGGRGRSPP